MSTRNRQSGFTLVEILIVVVILGILAAIVIPQFTSASEDAKSSSLYTQLQTIRSQLELYQVQHNGNYPPLTTGATATVQWSFMTGKSAATDTTTLSVDATATLGPYLQQSPDNPFTNSAHVIAGAANATNTGAAGGAKTDGWIYDAAGKHTIFAVGFDESTGKFTSP